MGLTIGLGALVLVIAFVLGVLEDVVYRLGGTQTVLYWVIGILAGIGLILVTVGLIKINRRHDANSLKVSAKLENTSQAKADEELANKRHH